MYEKPVLQVEEFAVNRNYAAQCSSEEIAKITGWPKDINVHCIIDGESLVFSDLNHTIDPSTGQHAACGTITCVSPDCVGGSGLFGYFAGGTYTYRTATYTLPAGHYIAWKASAALPDNKDQTRAKLAALNDLMDNLSGGTASAQGWHASFVDDNEAITSIIYGWSNNH